MTKHKSIGLTEEQYKEIVEAGKECGFNMDAGRGGQRGKFLTVAAKIAKFVILSERGENANLDDVSVG